MGIARHSWFAVFFFAASVVASGAAPAWGRTSNEKNAEATAKVLSTEAMKNYKLDDFASALDDYKAAYLAKPDPTFLFNIAQCYRKLGQSASAASIYRTYLRERPDSPNRQEVEAFIAEADKEVERLRLQAEKDQEIKRRQANAPPIGLETPPPAPETKPEPKVEVAPNPPEDNGSTRRLFTVGGIVLGAVIVVAVVGIGLGIGLSGSPNAPDHPGTAGEFTASFP